MEKSYTGIILAGGKSKRMGMEKGLVLFQDKPLVLTAISIFKETCTEILISSNSNSYNKFGLKVVPDVLEDSGPMGGIFSCLLESTNIINLVISCDMPFVTADIFELMIKKGEDSWICVPWHEKEHYEPLCGIYSRECLPDMKKFMDAGNYKLPELFRKTNFKALNVKEIAPGLPDYYFLNINSPSDLETARQVIR
jgi:molybdenum cofactor guanylyltransferase